MNAPTPRAARATVLGVVVVGVLGPIAVALASWFSSGAGDAMARADALGPGNVPNAVATAHRVELAWEATVLTTNPEVAALGYVVRRYADAPEAQPVEIECVVLVAANTCIEPDVTAGSWRYTVTPTYEWWVGTESAQSSPVVVAPPSLTLPPGQAVNATSRTVTGLALTGFRSDEVVELTIEDAEGTSPVLLDAVRTDETGALTVPTFEVPTDLPDGTYLVRAVGPLSFDVPPSEAFVVDTTAPTTVEPVVLAWSNDDVELVLAGADEPPGRVASLTYAIGAAGPTVVAGATVTAVVTESDPVTFFTTDAAGNRSEPRTVDVRIDRVGPTPGPLTAPPFVREGVVLENAPTDTESGVASVAFVWCPGTTCTPATTIGAPLTEAPYRVAWTGQPADGAYRLAVVVTDVAGNATPSAPVRVGIDNAGPTGVLNPVAAVVGAVAPLTATAIDASGVASVRFEHSADGGTWRPIDTATSGLLNVFGTVWSAGQLDAGAYAVRAIAIDRAGNSTTFPALTTTLYGPASVQLVNGGVNAGQMERGDRIIVTFTAAPRPIAMCPGAWNSPPPPPLAGSVSVAVIDGGGGNDRLTITSTNCFLGGSFGTVELGSVDYVGADGATFKGTGALASRIVYDNATRTLTVTLGDLVAGEVAPVTAPTVAGYTMSPGALSANLSLPAGTARTAPPGGTLNF